MKALLNNLRTALVLLILLAAGIIAGLLIQQDRSQTRMAAAGENRVALAQRYEQAGTIYASDGVELAGSEDGQRYYAEDDTLQRAVMPLVGDYTHIMTNTLEAQYEDVLLGTNRSFTDQLFLDVVGRGLRGDNLHLTLDSELTRKAYELLGNRPGAVAMLNYTTGEVIALASSPAASAEEVIRFRDLPDGALFNRALQGAYAPGSTFKVLTSAAWLDSAIYDPAYSIVCDGSPVVPNGAREREGHQHGPVDLNRAIRVSCNLFFGDVAVKMGGPELMGYIQNMGITEPQNLDRLHVLTTDLYTPVDDPALVSWFAIGQPSGTNRIRISPLQLASIIGGIVNDGVKMEPYIVDHISDPLGRERQRHTPSSHRMMNEHTAGLVEDLMLDAVNGEGAGGAPAQVTGLTIGGKTGTPEIEGQENNNAVFAGFIQEREYPYAIAVIVENSGYGSGYAAPIAHEMFRMIFERG